MKVMVTGGAGFIGSHIVDILIEQGYEVIVIDDLSTGSLDNLNPNAKLYEMSINDSRLKDVFNDEMPEIVCHHAAQTIVTDSIKDPLHDARVNILGSLNILNNCVRFKVKKIVYASSCAIYGNPAYLPVDERHPANPVSPYGVSKYTVEKYLFTYHSTYGLKYTALRYANVYGPRQNTRGEAGVVALFAHKMLSNQTCSIFGTGNKTRSYVFVKDVARANLIAINSDCNGIYNIGTDIQTTDQYVFVLLSKELDYPHCSQLEPLRPGEIMHMCLDSSHAKCYLGWESKVDFAHGIYITANDYALKYRNADSMQRIAAS